MHRVWRHRETMARAKSMEVALYSGAIVGERKESMENPQTPLSMDAILTAARSMPIAELERLPDHDQNEGSVVVGSFDNRKQSPQ